MARPKAPAPLAPPTVPPLDPGVYRDVVRRALDEDLKGGDITTEAIVSVKQRARGVVVGHVTNPEHFALNRGTAAPQTPAGWRIDRAAAARRGVVMSVGLLETRIASR